MVIPSAIGVSQPGWSKVKPPLCSHQSGWDAIHCNLPERAGERVDGWGGSGEVAACHILPLSQGILWSRLVILRGILWPNLRWTVPIQNESCLITSWGVCGCVCVYTCEYCGPFVPTFPPPWQACFITLTAYCLSIPLCSGWFTLGFLH